MDRGRTTDDQKSSLGLSAQVRYKEKNAPSYHTALIGISKSKFYYQSLIYYQTYFINIIDERNLQYANISRKEVSIWKQH